MRLSTGRGDPARTEHTSKTRHQTRPPPETQEWRASIAKFRKRRSAHICEHHDRNVSIEIDNLEQKSRAELRVLWGAEFAGKAPPAGTRYSCARYCIRQDRRYGGLARPGAKDIKVAQNRILRAWSKRLLRQSRSAGEAGP
jgi:hypothetical protein